MKTHSLLIREIAATPTGRVIRINDQLSRRPEPGEYCLAFAPAAVQILPQSLFLYTVEEEGILLCGKIPADWQPGTAIQIQGPFGHGFQSALTGMKIALYAADAALQDRLHPLVQHALKRGAEVVWITDEKTEVLPAQVEILRPADLVDAVNWANSCAITASMQNLNQICEVFRRHPEAKQKVEVMLDTPLVCGNIARCGACAVETTKGWRLACTDGPVFKLEEISGG
jgi:NAD(P)H-flavin reductase